MFLQRKLLSLSSSHNRIILTLVVKAFFFIISDNFDRIAKSDHPSKTNIAS